ncbi:TPA: pentapeptide repeat-containing protein [Campylobacter jejuni]|uniref:pentapeptide repeat-containing protein n=1 Tax=Campylobacter jejuni TaxID=197 RepID=UPI0006993C8C|nr:pentapeptide repeat-containing protein [Campylobacter jejuni]EAH5604023.1 pentapeptide repeat-containing protein [Campylobacter jejuni]EAH5604952.1 pentapeptide repeat-containing protein [Campylobacter jejuni]EAI1457403.1 pentapeptide repeat-containing protein [Campylobacter jejuni]EAI9334539.1 pentapeptide repeat-containing protein [Campylobacter jejuni]EAJ2577927.1 pentapeptide repeat-containing protein [Campylobacter jejuni]
MGEFDKEQAIADIAENLGISKEYVNFDENKKIYIIKDNNNLKKIHIKNFNYKLYERYNLSFTKCIFECEIKDTRGLSSDIENGIFFLKCEFENKILFFNLYFKNISFILCNFKNNTTFQACTFKTFCNFESSVFENFVSFDKSMFLDKVSFYNTHFHKVPNFSQAIFNENLNIVNTKLNFTFSNLEEKIEQECEEFNKNKKEEDQKSLDKFANDFRDSFRIFKNALIKDNNLLDASNFHKYELYCKEIELKNKKGKTFKDVVDRWQLIFYCKLCDHHTDILQSLNSLILVIGIFVISSVAMVFGFNYSLGYKPILEHWYFSLDFYNHHINSIIQDNCLLMIFVNLMILFIYLGLVGFALCLKYMREFFIIISYVITLLVLAVSPKILIPAMGIFTDKRAMLDPLSVLGGIYTIVFGFVAFSFIKTIRKNSIVPS